MTDATKPSLSNDAAAAITPQAESPAREAWRMFLRNRSAILGLALLAAIIIVTIAGPYIYPVDPFEVVWAPFTPPNTEAVVPLGTDHIGRDILAALERIEARLPDA